MVRFKNRYTVLEIIQNDPSINNKSKITNGKLCETLTKNLLKYCGDFGAAAVNLRIQYYNEKTSIAIIRTRHGTHRLFTSILPFITVVFGELVRLRSIYIGAAIKQCQKFIIKHHQNFVDRTAGKIKNQLARETYIREIMKIKSKMT